MKLTLDPFSIIILLGIIQGYYLALIVFRNQTGNQRANRYLALLLLSFSFSISNAVLFKSGLYRYIPYIVKMPTNIIFLFGPFFYFYIRHLTSHDFKLSAKNYLHFLPAFLIFLYFLPFYLQNISVKFSYVSLIIQNDKINPKYYDQIVILVLAQIHFWCYLICIHRLIKKHVQNLKRFYSSIEEKNLDWVKYCINTTMIVFILIIPLFILVLRSQRFLIAFNALGAIVSVAIYIVGYRGLKQTEIFSPTIEPQKASKNSSSINRVSSYVDKINKLMVEEKLYTAPELTLDSLAKELSISRGLLSQILNDELGISFYDYINRLRVEETKRLLLESDNTYLTIMALAAQSGFNSKTSFNRIFKKYTDMTPSEFIRQHKGVDDKNDKSSENSIAKTS